MQPAAVEDAPPGKGSGKGKRGPSASDAFSSATLTLLTSPAESATSSSVVELDPAAAPPPAAGDRRAPADGDGAGAGGEEGGGEAATAAPAARTYGTTSFYRDPSGRARLHLRLRLGFPTAEGRGAVLGSGCVRPAPRGPEAEEEKKEEDDDGDEGEEGEAADGEVGGAGAGAAAGRKKKGEGGAAAATALRFECCSVPERVPPGSPPQQPAGALAVEGATVLSTRLEDGAGDEDGPRAAFAIVFDVEVAVRAPPRRGGYSMATVRQLMGMRRTSPLQRSRSLPDAILEEMDDEEAAGASPASDPAAGAGEGAHPPAAGGGAAAAEEEEEEEGGAGEASLSRLEIRAVLSRKKTRRAPAGGGDGDGGGVGPGADPGAAAPKRGAGGLALGLLALELGAGVHHAGAAAAARPAGRGSGGAEASAGTRYGTSLLRTAPVLLRLRLVSALTVTVREVGGARAAMGATLLSLTVAHSDAHDEDVSVTNIALHPGHSRLWTPPAPLPPPGAAAGGAGKGGVPGPPGMVHRSVSAPVVASPGGAGGGGGGPVAAAGGGGGGVNFVHPQQQQAAALQQAYAARRATNGAGGGGGPLPGGGGGPGAGSDDATVATTASNSSAVTGLPRGGSVRTGGSSGGGASGVGSASASSAASGYGYYHPSQGYAHGHLPPPPPAAPVHGVSSINPDGRSMQGGEHSVVDMSRHVRWGFAHGTAPALPLVLRPREAVATVIKVDAGENLRNRTFVSPVAVTAVVGEAGGGDGDGDGSAEEEDEEEKAERPPREEEERAEREPERRRPRPLVVVSTDARWTTARLAAEPADAFRVDMSLRESSCRVGAPVVVGLKVMNLSNETRDLMLLMAKDEESSRDKDAGLGRWGGAGAVGAGAGRRPGGGGGPAGGGPYYASRFGQRVVARPYGAAGGGAARGGGGGYYQQSPPPPPPPSHHHGVNTAVVSEVNGYTFGVWGLSGDDDGTTRHNRDHELLAVDAALLLGEVKGQHTIEAELRFVPLREGTLDVPNLKLYDKMGGRWYNCVHLLKIVAAAKV